MDNEVSHAKKKHQCVIDRRTSGYLAFKPVVGSKSRPVGLDIHIKQQAIMCELNLVKPSPLSSSVKPSILHSCMNDLTLSDRARLRASHLCSISLAAMMDDHQPF